MPFFHATDATFPLRHHLKSPHPVVTCLNAVKALEADPGRPPNAPSRTACYFACENPENAVHFLEAEVRHAGRVLSGPILAYQVDFPAGHHKGSMALIRAIEKRLGAGGSATKMIAEYWKPTLNWKFFEAFGPEMRILASVPVPSDPWGLAFSRYLDDGDLAARL